MSIPAVWKAAPGVETSADRLPQEPDVFDVAVFGDQQGCDLDAVAEPPGMPVPLRFLHQQEACEVGIGVIRGADQGVKDLLPVLPPQINGQTLLVMSSFETQ
ncbi:hypothetical protein FHR32_008545 [Streptosporangium album]|uniref:Uncharacterized protein n=1 Tax=Streptosporangium album TaxID=47479 RepID=A0A7W7WDX5_9ACTN|nr:hypothetical protein [Streptosporangium album]MBB4944142.1 hypothetical protein [Streptosporangium album]